MANLLIHNFLENSAVRFPDKVALIHENTRATYSRINTDSDRLSSYLDSRGVKKGDRVVIILGNSYEYVVAYYGTLKAGAVAVPLSTDLKPDGLSPLLLELEPKIIISSSRFERLIQASDLQIPTLRTVIVHNPKLDWKGNFGNVIPFSRILSGNTVVGATGNNLSPTDLASIIYTSGSTGKPKGAMLTHGNIVSNTQAICEYLRLGPDDKHMVVLPFFYVMGKSLLNTHIAAGGTVVINNRFAYPAPILKQMSDEKVTGFSGVPSTYAYLLHRSPLREYRDRLDALRFCAQAGGHMARAVKIKLREVLPDHTEIFIMYGATEGAARLTYLSPEQFTNKMDSIGKPIPGVRIKILDENDHEVPPGEIGELHVNGPNIMSGYWKNPEVSAEVLGSHGYRTGDMGYVDKEGYIYLTGRKDNLLKVGGHRVNTQEVEDFLLSTELVVETVVVGSEDALMGHRLRAVIVPREKTLDVKYLSQICSKSLPKYKIPSEFIIVSAIPKQANGKTDWAKCLRTLSRFKEKN